MSFRTFLRSALIIVTITAILDFAITSLFRQQIHDLLTDDAQRATEAAYRYDVPYHHDLRPSLDTDRRWGTLTYRHVTDGYSLRSGTCGGEDLEIHSIGDCVAPRQANLAIHEGRKLGLSL